MSLVTSSASFISFCLGSGLAGFALGYLARRPRSSVVYHLHSGVVSTFVQVTHRHAPEQIPGDEWKQKDN